MIKGTVLAIYQKFPKYDPIVRIEWDPHNTHYRKSAYTAEVYISRTVGSIKNQGEDFYFVIVSIPV